MALPRKTPHQSAGKQFVSAVSRSVVRTVQTQVTRVINKQITGFFKKLF